MSRDLGVITKAELDKVTKLGDDWMNHLNKKRLHEAFKLRAKSVTLINGQKLSLKYVTVDGDAKVRLKPIASTEHPNAFVPCGTFSMRVVTDPSWLS